MQSYQDFCAPKGQSGLMSSFSPCGGSVSKVSENCLEAIIEGFYKMNLKPFLQAVRQGVETLAVVFSEDRHLCSPGHAGKLHNMIYTPYSAHIARGILAACGADRFGGHFGLSTNAITWRGNAVGEGLCKIGEF